MKVVVWGTYDLGKPRNRIMLAALRDARVEVVEIHSDVWGGLEDKSQARGWVVILRRALRWLFAYPWLILRYLWADRHDGVLVGYLGHLDVFILWPFARLRGRRIVWDAFLSLSDTIVHDRRLVGPRHPLARAIGLFECTACRLADRVVLDTEAHAALFREWYGLPKKRTASIFVGAEHEVFADQSLDPAPPSDPAPGLTILFYGQFIPLHGIGTIVEAAQRASHLPHRWVLIGRGQEEARIQRLIEEGPPARIEWISWVDYAELGSRIRAADICLGIFGTSQKAANVIPNKVFQILSVGAPLITRDSPAIRELLSEPTTGVHLVPPGDPDSIVLAIERVQQEKSQHPNQRLSVPASVRERFSTPVLGQAWRRLLAETFSRP